MTATDIERPPLFTDDDYQPDPDDAAEALATLLRSGRYQVTDEYALQAAIAAHLDGSGVPFAREVVLDAARRLDFLVGGTAIEVKVDGSTSALRAQIERYANHPTVTGVVVVTALSQHLALGGRTLTGKPVQLVYLSQVNGRIADDPAVRLDAASDGSIRRVGEQWLVDAQPHVMTRLRRLLAQVSQTQADGGAARVTATPDTARDIEMLRFRYRLDMSPEDEALLTSEADAHRALGDTVVTILNGDRQPMDGLRVPARPPRWPCQERNADLISVVQGLLIGDKLGRGKTYSGSMALRNPDALPAIVVCPPNIQDQWARELAATWPDLTVHIAQKKLAYALPEPPDVLIVPYSKMTGWADAVTGVARTAIFDEIQHLRNGALGDTSTGSARGAACKQVAHAATYRVGLSATPVHNYGGDIFNIMEVLRPGLLGTRPEFTREWCGQSNNGKQIVADPAALAAFLLSEGAMIADPGDPKEPAERIEHVIESDPIRFDLLTSNVVAMAESMLSDDTTREERFTAGGQFEMWMRQATGIAKAPYVATFVEMLLRDDDVGKVLLIGYHREVYRIWQEKLARFGVAMYTGSESPAQKAKSVDQFVDGPARVMMMSLSSGEGLDGLQKACNVVVFGELDWSPAVPAQIIGRLDRPGQTQQVLAYFLTSDRDDSADPHMLNTLGLKGRQGAPFNTGEAAAAGALDSGVVGSKADNLRRLAQAIVDRHGR